MRIRDTMGLPQLFIFLSYFVCSSMYLKTVSPPFRDFVAQEPEVGVNVTVEVTFGIVGMPFQSLVQARIIEAIHAAITKRFVNPNRTKFRALVSVFSSTQPHDFGVGTHICIYK